MTESSAPDGLDPTTELVWTGSRWVAQAPFLDGNGIELTQPAVLACLMGTAPDVTGPPAEIPPALATRRRSSLIGATRLRWLSDGWGAAFQLVQHLDGPTAPTTRTVEAPTRVLPDPGSPRSALPWLRTVVARAGADTSSQLDVVVGVVDVDGLSPGWYTQDLHGRLGDGGPTVPELQRAIPVGAGRARFAISAVAVVVASPTLLHADAATYASTHIEAGVITAQIERAAGDADLPHLASYAVASELFGWSGEARIPLAAVSLGQLGTEPR